MTIWQRLRKSTALAVVMLLVGVTGVMAQVLGEVGNRFHEFKQVAGAESETLPGTRIADAPCEDGTATTTDAGGTEYSFSCDGLDLVSFVPSAEMFTLRDPLTSCLLDLATGAVAPEEAGCLAEDTGISDIWGWTSPETGDEYIIFGKTNGAAFYNISDPADPQYYGEIPNVSGELLWFDVKVNDDVAYIVSESPGYGVVTFDLSQLDSMEPAPSEYFPLTENSRFFPGTDTPAPVTAPNDASNHNVVIDTDNEVLYLVGGNTGIVQPGACTGGFYAMDISAESGDQFNPPFLGCVEAEGDETRTDSTDTQTEDDTIYVHDAQCAAYTGPDPDYAGRDICVGSNEEIVVFFDVTDIRDGEATEISRVAYPDASYSHQGWMDEDQRYYFNGDELDELYDSDVTNTRTIVIDMQDLDEPFVEALYDHDTVAIDHNMYTHDGLLYQSNYTAGLRVFDVEQSIATFDGESVGPKTEGLPEDEEEEDEGGLPVDQQASGQSADGDGTVTAAAVAGEEQLVETMFFDTFPDDDQEPVTEFAGTWSNYPYFESGVIPVTGIADGFFLLRPSELRPASDGAADDQTTDDDPAPAPDEEADDADLAATGGGAAALAVGIGLLAVAVVLRRREESPAG